MAKRLTTEEVIRRCVEVHGDRYDYSNTEYLGTGKKISIVCSKHGKFDQLFHDHIRTQGCRKCAGVNVPTSAEFIENARSRHGNKYDYRNVKYINNRTKVEIICRDHGSFYQSPTNHLSESIDEFCKKCADDKKAKNRFGFEYKGKEYRSLKDLHDKLNPENEYDTFRHWVSQGMSIDDALSKKAEFNTRPGVVYVITCLPTGLQYVGSTCRTVESRWAGHVSASRYLKCKMSEAIRQYGKDAFTIDSLCACKSGKELSRKEKETIDSLDTLNNGLNTYYSSGRSRSGT